MDRQEVRPPAPDQQHIHSLTQTCELAFVVENDGLDSGSLGD
jgi:hypothetical protein